jgi:hypothetical protein
MTNLRDILEAYVADGTVPGAVALVARGDRTEVEAVGVGRHRRRRPWPR